MVKLIGWQVRLLSDAAELADANKEMRTDNVPDTLLCMCMVANGLLSESEERTCTFTITPAGRAWLAEKEKKHDAQ